MRGKIRKAQREADFAVSGPEAIDSFYPVFCRNMRDLGTPVYPLRFFQLIGRSFAPAVRLFLVSWKGRTVAAAFGLTDRTVLHLPWICSDYRCKGIYATEYLYWSVLQWAADHHFAIVDLGRSTVGSGGHRFKRQFRPQEQILTWYYWTSNRGPAPNLSPDNPRLRWACRLWSHLPLAIANHLGPWIVRNLP
jgi:predicted N-acyltransferase